MLGSLLSRPSNAVNLPELTWGQWPGDAPKTAGPPVTRMTAMQLMAVYGSVRLITDGVSTLPVDVYDSSGGTRTETPKPDWLTQPTDTLDYESWATQILTSLLLDGNAYIMIWRDRRTGRISQLPVLDPETVTVKRDPGTNVLRYTRDGRELPRNDLVHIRGLMLPGDDKGLSPVEYARRTIGLGLAAVDYGAEFFNGDGNMPGVIEVPHPMQPDTRDELAKQWRRKRRTKGLPGVLWNDAKWKPTGVNHEQMQFLATRQFSAGEIAGQMFLVDPTDLGIPVDGSSITYANLQQRNTRRVQVTFLPWIVRLEKALTSLAYGTNRYVKLNVDGLLRGDPTQRWANYQIAHNIGALDTDEIRELEDMPPLTPEQKAQTSPPEMPA